MKVCLFSICFIYPLWLISEVFTKEYFNGTAIKVPYLLAWLLAALCLAIGAVVLLVDLWRSRAINTEAKALWAFVLIFFGGLPAPLYWLIVVNGRAVQIFRQQGTRAAWQYCGGLRAGQFLSTKPTLIVA